MLCAPITCIRTSAMIGISEHGQLLLVLPYLGSTQICIAVIAPDVQRVSCHTPRHQLNILEDTVKMGTKLNAARR